MVRLASHLLSWHFTPIFMPAAHLLLGEQRHGKAGTFLLNRYVIWPLQKRQHSQSKNYLLVSNRNLEAKILKHMQTKQLMISVELN